MIANLAINSNNQNGKILPDQAVRGPNGPWNKRSVDPWGRISSKDSIILAIDEILDQLPETAKRLASAHIRKAVQLC